MQFDHCRAKHCCYFSFFYVFYCCQICTVQIHELILFVGEKYVYGLFVGTECSGNVCIVLYPRCLECRFCLITLLSVDCVVRVKSRVKVM